VITSNHCTCRRTRTNRQTPHTMPRHVPAPVRFPSARTTARPDRGGRRVDDADLQRLRGEMRIVEAVHLDVVPPLLRNSRRIHRQRMTPRRNRRVRPTHRRRPRQVHHTGHGAPGFFTLFCALVADATSSNPANRRGIRREVYAAAAGRSRKQPRFAGSLDGLSGRAIARPDQGDSDRRSGNSKAVQRRSDTRLRR